MPGYAAVPKNLTKQKRHIRSWVLQTPSRTEWKWLIASMAAFAALPVIRLVPRLIEHELHRPWQSAAIFGGFLLLLSAGFGGLGAAMTLILIRFGGIYSRLVRHVDAEHEAFAREVGGRIERGRDWLSGKRWVRILYAAQGREVVVEVLKEHSGEDTYAWTSFNVPGAAPQGFYAHAFPKGRFEKVANRLGMSTVLTYEEQFDEAFVTRANNTHMVAEMITATVSDSMFRLREWSTERPTPKWHRQELEHVELKVQDEAIQIRIRGSLESTAQLREFSRLGGSVAEAVRRRIDDREQ